MSTIHDPQSAIQTAFPALRRRHNGFPVAYFDGPGGTQVPQAVVDAMTEYLLHHNANTHWRYPTSEETDAALASARAAFADFLGCERHEVAFGANMTTLTFHLARALGRSWREGDEVVVTELDHHANVDPWRAVARERGLVVRAARIDPATAELDWDDLAAHIGDRTKLVAIGAAANAIGTINDVARAARLARDAGALLFVDAVHYAPHALVDVRAMDCDFLACSAYKFYGPHVGVMFGRGERLATLDVPKLEPAPDAPPERLETGTQNHEGIVGAAAAVDWLARIGGIGSPDTGGPGASAPGRFADRRTALRRTYEMFAVHGDAMFDRLWHGLRGIPGVRLYGRPPGQPRTPTVAFSVAGWDAGDVAAALAARGLFVSHGDFYAATLVNRLAQGTDGLIRAGAACYTTEEEVDRLVTAVRSLRD